MIVTLITVTGSGKTLPLFLSIALYDKGTCTVLILPLLAMHDEYKVRARKHGLSCETWESGNSSPSSQLILVAVENCVWDRFKSYVETLIRMGRLARIVVDEAHLLHKHASFRPCVESLEYLGRMPASILLMTATCPRHMEQSLFAMLGRRVYHVLRRGTDRPEISQTFVALLSEDMEKTVAAKVQSITQQFQRKDRALLFCWSHDECDRMAELLGWKPYHALIPPDDRSLHKKTWEQGGIVGLACTSMLNCCLDYPNVRIVFHLGPPRDAIDYSQAIGRTGRIGEASQSIVYFDPTRMKKPTGEDLYGCGVVYDTLRDNLTCRRLRFATFLDGYAIPCSMLPSAQLCDVCEGETACAPPDNGPLRLPAYPLPTLPHSPLTHPAGIPVPNLTTVAIQRPPIPPAVRPPHRNLLNQPAPLATFGTHFAAAQAALRITPPTYSEQRGLEIRAACQALTGSCVHCWAHGFEYQSHRLMNCRLNEVQQMHPEWKTWGKLLRLPVGCCFFCGCSLKV